jgi:hypothetical protein
MLRREAQIARLLSILTTYVQIKVYMIPSCPRFEDFAPQRRKLMQRLHSAAWILYHFLETYRDMMIFDHPKHPSSETTRATECHSCNDLVQRLLRIYPEDELIPAYHFYDLVLQHFRQLSRSPSYIGPFERRLRGKGRSLFADADLAQYIILGGIPQLCKLSVMKGTFYQRSDIIWSFLDKVESGITTQVQILVPTKQKRSLAAGMQLHEGLMHSLDPPFQAISRETVSCLPSLERFMGDEWEIRMLEVMGKDEEITSAFGFVQNILAGKTDGKDYLEPVKLFES